MAISHGRAGLLALAMAATSVQGAHAAGALPCAIPDGAVLSERDLARAGGLVWSRTRGLAAALAEGDDAARATLSALYAEGLAPTDTMPEGGYRCRTIKLGGILPLVVYGYFACEVGQGADGLTITKTTGSQRFQGSLTPAGDGLFYQGALNYSDEGPVAYRGDTERDQVGCLYRAGEESDVYILELPSPLLESFHDVIELVPAR